MKNIKKNNKINKEVNDKFKEIVDNLEEKIDCTGGYSVKVGYIYYNNILHTLFLEFGKGHYFSAFNNKCNVKNKELDDITDFKFTLIESNTLCENIKNQINKIIENHNKSIENKEKFLKMLGD